MGKKARKIGSQAREEVSQGPSALTKVYWALGAAAVIGIGSVGYVYGTGPAGSTATLPVELDQALLDDPALLAEAAEGVVKGAQDAPLTIVEFADFQCPACRQFQNSVKSLIESQYIDTGKAKFVFYDFPITTAHGNAFIAARAARCADTQGRFWEFHDMLFAQQLAWSYEPNPVRLFEEYAGQLGMDVEVFGACVK